MAEAEYVLARKILKLANRIVSGRNTDIRDLGLTSSQADSLVYSSTMRADRRWI